METFKTKAFVCTCAGLFYLCDEGDPALEFTAATLSAELKRQISSKLPAKSLAGAAKHLVVSAGVKSAVSSTLYFEAIGILLQQLADEHPDWEIEFAGDLDDLTITFSK
jgi:hypothetical protein